MLKRIKNKIKREKKNRKYVIRVAEAAGWSTRYAEKRMKSAKAKYGTKYREYLVGKLYTYPEDKEKTGYDAYLKRVAMKAAKEEMYINFIMEASGWEKDYAVEQTKKAWKRNGISTELFAVYKFWQVPEEMWGTYFSKGDVNDLRKKYNKDEEIVKIFHSKELFCEKFEKYLGRPWCINENMSFETFCEKFGKSGKILYKSPKRSGGKGIFLYEYDENTAEDVYNKVKSKPYGLIEGYFTQHPEMQKFSLKSVNTLRVGTIVSYDDIPGTVNGKVNIVYIGFRMGAGDSFVDNLHSNGIIADVDVNTGEVITDGVDFKNTVFKRHPDTGEPIKGFKIPYFEEMKTMIEEAGDEIEGYYGWDVAIGEKGPVIIEVNTNAGPTALQAAYVPENKGMRYVIEKYL